MSSDSSQVAFPQFDRMIKGIIKWNSISASALIVAGFLISQSLSLAAGIAIGAALATVNAVLLARKLKTISADTSPMAGQAAMMGSMALRFLVMGAGVAVSVFVLGLDKLGIAGLLAALVVFQLVSGWFASRAMQPTPTEHAT